MCGIAGFWFSSQPYAEEAQEQLRAMGDALRHRGPDDGGYWYQREAGVGFAHRRLAIVDLSSEGHQPMASSSGRYVICFNGEVYNFSEIRGELTESNSLAGPLRGHSDTEIMLAAIDAWGLERAVKRFVGMFAFALWDNQERALHLVRDRLGIKPLFFAALPGGVIFGSELKALRAVAQFPEDLDQSALAAYFRLACVPAPKSIYRSARKLLPGTILTFAAAASSQPSELRYWSAASVAERGVREPFVGTDDEAVDELERELTEAVRLRMIADVPLGAFLSGGIDSSTVVALMQKLSARPVRTFSIGNETARYDESAAAARVAAHLGTEHTSLVITADAALSVIPYLPRMYDEPFADSSQIPTYLVSRMARQHVTVALSGDGGDEVFGGYNRHVWGPPLWSVLKHMPVAARRAAAQMLLSVSPSDWDALFDSAGRFLPKLRRPGQQVHKLARILDAVSFRQLYDTLCSQWSSVPMHAKSIAEPEHARLIPDVGGGAHEMMLLDLTTYLPDDILTKVDRASMAVALEARVPILDHRVVEFAWRLERKHKLRNGVSKWALRKVLSRHVPQKLVSGPKSGFSIPIGDWLRGPLREWAHDLLTVRALEKDDLLNPTPILKQWREHLSGARDWSQQLWVALVFQQWRAAS